MRKKLALLSVLMLFVVTVLIIWYFSAQDATASYSLSGRVTERICTYCPWLSKLLTADEWMPIMRKIAHFVLYAVLGMAISVVLVVMYGTDWPLMRAILAGIVLAVSDELHQAFVPGRHACVDDVLVDVLGVCMGIVFIAACDTICRAFSRRARP